MATYDIRPVDGAMPSNPAFDERAACRGLDTEFWFSSNAAAREFAVETCIDCPIRRGCEQYGIASRQTGIWGGSVLDRGRPEGAARGWRNPYPVVPAGPRRRQPVPA
ncbi:WhiB family transcriptional regulator [Nakamurella multipartita]|uniref:Transcription factor WhiB n=1 Tax=Nakamurella multipartita (strain ATCC 700099 / DSM 44233 / CIP 104796 / JCM 9543 / NBRC 105858 / Y-104) TaxID=479431 RepID=C8X8M0_NAKMY|nr:WhiB family transcriptional regulator [Nakamurella multipartita]ACV79075.1 transcription factor WhiB [Nakamurella multipartita DSM 44233]